MRSVLLAVLLLSGVMARAGEPVKASLVSEVAAFVPGQAFTVGLRLVHDKGWHTYWKDPGDAGLPTQIKWKLPRGFKAGPIQWPQPERFTDPTGIKGYGYEGDILLPVEIRPPKDPGVKEAALKAEASWLACREVCIPGKAALKLDLKAWGIAEPSESAPLFDAARRGPATGSGSLAWMLLLAFLGGLLLNLMPCVLPALSLKVLALARQAGGSRVHSLKLGTAYSLGILVSFWGLAGLVLALKAAGGSVGWGFQFQNPLFVLCLCLVVTVFALNLLGVFEFILPGFATQGLDQASAGSGLVASFLQGAFTTLLATPCTAPFLGTALGFAFSQSGPVLFLIFSYAGLGLALPAFLLSAWPGALSWVPKPGAWMERLKQALGFLLLATALWLLWVLGSQTGLEAVIWVAAFLLVVAAVCWMIGAFLVLGSSRGRKIAVLLVSLALLGAGCMLFLKPFFNGLKQGGQGSGETLKWEAYSPERLKDLRKKGRIVFLDFTAQWCWTCKINEKAVLESGAVAREFGSKKVALLKADFTSQDPEIFKALRSFGSAGVPLYVVYPADKDQPPVVLSTLLTTSMVVDALTQAGK